MKTIYQTPECQIMVIHQCECLCSSTVEGTEELTTGWEEKWS